MAAVALLRAVNVGGNGKVGMADLAAMFRALGLGDVKTLLTTGNVLFDHEVSDGIETMIERETERCLGLRTTIFVRSAGEWRALIEANPYADMAENDPSHLVVVVLKNAPALDAEARLRVAITGRETVRIVGRQLYACYPDGIGNSKLTMPVIEKAVGTPGTGRNWNTVQKIAAGLQGRR